MSKPRWSGRMERLYRDGKAGLEGQPRRRRSFAKKLGDKLSALRRVKRDGGL